MFVFFLRAQCLTLRDIPYKYGWYSLLEHITAGLFAFVYEYGRNSEILYCRQRENGNSRVLTDAPRQRFEAVKTRGWKGGRDDPNQYNVMGADPKGGEMTEHLFRAS